MSVTAYMREFESIMTGHQRETAPPSAYALAITRASRDAAGETIAKYIASGHYSVGGLAVTYDGKSRTVIVRGIAADASTRNNVVACCRKIIGVAHVTDLLTIAESPSLEAKYRMLKHAAAIAR